MNDINGMFEDLHVEEKGIRTTFQLDGLNFWFNRKKGMVRLHSVARELLKAIQADSASVAVGKYDDLINMLMANAVYDRGEGQHPLILNPSGYATLMDELEASDPHRAVGIFEELPSALAVVCLGKKLLSAMVVKEAGSTTSATSKDQSPPDTEGALESPLSTTEISQPPAQGFRVEAN